MNGRTVTLLFVSVLCAMNLFAATSTDVVADSLIDVLSGKLQRKEFALGEFYGKLYLKQYADVDKSNLALNIIPDMTRFDRKVDNYLTELFYDVHYLDYAVPDVRRRMSITTHRHGSGEMERVLEYMTPDIYSEEMFDEGYLSPMHKVNSKNYRYGIDTLYSDTAKVDMGCTKLLFEQRFDNIKLFDEGWILLDDSCNVRELYLKGWDEQSRFEVHYKMGNDGLRRFVVKDISLTVYYDFGGNKLTITAEGRYNFDTIHPLSDAVKKGSRYDLSANYLTAFPADTIKNKIEYAARNRLLSLTAADTLLYKERGIFGKSTLLEERKKNRLATPARWLWTLGDEMISSHSMEWEGGRLKFYPLINPSYLSYSSSRGFSYKFALNLNNRFKSNRELYMKPMVGYNFKQKAFYWDVTSTYLFDPRNLGRVTLDFGLGNRTYSSAVLDRIEKLALDSLNFNNLNLNYFKNFYLNLWGERELFNGFELRFGVDFHRRTLVGSIDDVIKEEGIELKERYTQFAPHLRLTWWPGMYYYIYNGRKVNVGSKQPRFMLDVEQGTRGVLGSNSVYTRAEFDVQYRKKVNAGDVLYMRFGGGGYFYTKDVYFVDYAFLHDDNLPVDWNDEIGGVFQLLDGEWYNAAKKYLRANFSYESPFLVFQKLLPQVRFIKHERIYLNLLAISHLRPYSEYGYGIETPYVDMGLFMSFENTKFHKVGYKITISLFRD